MKGKAQKERKKMKEDKGITLIALIIMIVIIVILSAVVIRGFVGNEGIIDTTTEAAEDYNITAYKEQVEQAVRGIIIKHNTIGEEITVAEIADELDEETIWVKSSVPYTDESITNIDMLVRVTDGYVYQVYYNNLYGVVFVEYVGKDDGKEFPTLKTRYEKSHARVYAESSYSEGSIKRIEMLYRGEIKDPVRENPTGEVNFDVQNIGTGWYVIRSTSNTGKLRYAWERVRTVSEKLPKPLISLNPSKPDGANGGGGWYNKPVEVTITATDMPSGASIYYSIPNVSNPESSEAKIKYEGPFPVDKLGSTTIRAWTEDAKGLVSLDEDTRTFKIDTEKPTIENKTSKDNMVGGWYKDNVDVTIGGGDNYSGLAGYKYMIKGPNNNWLDKGMEDVIPVTEEGMTEITVKTVDIATNESNVITINIPKDTEGPVFQGSIGVTEITTTGFKISGYAIDEVSGSSTYGGEVTYECYVTEVGTSNRRKVGEANNTGIFTASGLNPRKDYNIEVIATDPAGNPSTANGRGTTQGELNQPSIGLSGTKGDNNWYRSNVNVTITYTGDINATRATGLYYEVINQANGAVAKSGNGSLPSTSFEFTTDGRYTVRAWSQDSSGGRSGIAEDTTLIRDTVVDSASIVHNGHTKNTITVTAGGADYTSQIRDYTFQYKISSWNDADDQWATATTQGTTGYTYPSSVIAAGQTYDLRVIVRDYAGNISASGKTTVVTNVAPVFTEQAWCTDRYTRYINLRTIATDGDGDYLTYTLYWGTDPNGLGYAEQKGGNQGEVVTFNRSNLAPYTTYYWRVDVWDGIVTTYGTVNSIRTYCETTRCDGPFEGLIICPDCNGSKKTAQNCSR